MTREPARRPVRAVLWDADGVLQHQPGGWVEWLEEAGGPGFADAVFAAEVPALRGEVGLRDSLDEVLRARPDSRVEVVDLLALWERAVLDADAMALVAQTRASGVLAVLATNQQDHRRAWMRDVLGMDTHMDRAFYSCEMGVAKPDPAYFRHILDALGLDAEETGFVDDSLANVEAARSVGIRSVHHDPASGSAVLRDEVAGLLGR